MKKYVICYNLIEGFHHWRDAPDDLKYLSFKHRHNFIITTKYQVSNNDREIEINNQQNKIEKYLKNKYSKNGIYCDFENMSCEDICEDILNNFDECYYCKVLEDGYGGAEIVR